MVARCSSSSFGSAVGREGPTWTWAYRSASARRCPGMSVNDRGSTSGPYPAVAAGLTIALCALTAAAAAAVVIRSVARFTFWFGWFTIPALWPLLAGVLLAGAALAARPRAGHRAGVVALVCAAQLLGGGVAASRDWFNVAGASGMPTHRLTVVLPLTVVVVVAATVACCVASAVIRRHSRAADTRWWRPAAPAYVIAGVIVAVVLPVAWAAFVDSLTVTALGQAALTWSLPWGISLAAAGWLDQRSRLAALTTVTASLGATITVFLALAAG